MKILFTGGSSFSGVSFVKELAKAGHSVTATLLKKVDSYSGTRGERVKMLAGSAEIVDECPFGEKRFLDLIESEGKWELLCHHAADVTDYKSPSFDYLKAAANNSRNVEEVLERLQKKGCNKLLLTGSVFEEREGIGNEGLRAVSPYGLSKGITSDIFEYFCQRRGVSLGKFVIPNPFGPYEEERFIAYLMRRWFAEEPAEVSCPDYVRDNIHVELLAKRYQQFASELMGISSPFIKANPSGYVGAQGAFTELVASEMRERSSLPCEVVILPQKSFLEPLIRINSDPVNGSLLGFSEVEAWDRLFSYYKEKLNSSFSF